MTAIPPVGHMLRGSCFDRGTDNVPRPWRLSWGRLSWRLQQHAIRADVADKLLLPAWSPATYPDGATRGKAFVDAVTCLALDYDDGTPLDVALAPWGGVAACWYSTWSHTDELPKFRVVMPLEVPVDGARWPDAWRWVAEVAVGIDAKCCDASRLYFLPAVRHASWPRFAGARDGSLLQMDYRAPPPPPKAAPRPPVRATSEGWRERIERNELMKRDPDVRRMVGEHLGGRIEARGVVKGVTCPACGRPSLWWPLVPTGAGVKAMCEHIGSCNQTFFLDELVEGTARGRA